MTRYTHKSIHIPPKLHDTRTTTHVEQNVTTGQIISAMGRTDKTSRYESKEILVGVKLHQTVLTNISV